MKLVSTALTFGFLPHRPSNHSFKGVLDLRGPQTNAMFVLTHGRIPETCAKHQYQASMKCWGARLERMRRAFPKEMKPPRCPSDFGRSLGARVLGFASSGVAPLALNGLSLRPFATSAGP